MSKTQTDSTQLSLLGDAPSLAPTQATMTKQQNDDKQTKKGFAGIGSLLERFTLQDKGGFITQEFQDFGYRLANELNDLPHKSLYMRLAKDLESRPLIEQALAFVKDADSARNKARLFMWKLKQLKEERKKLHEKKA